MTKKQSATVELTFWDEYDCDVESFEFKTEAEAIEYVKKAATNNTKYKGWSLTDDNHRFIIEVGENIIPLQ